MTTPVYYYCKHCNKQYKTESGRDKHELACPHNQEAIEKKTAFMADLEQIRLTANSPYHLFTLLETAYANIGLTLTWTRIPSNINLTCKKYLSDAVNKDLPEAYPVIYGNCRIEIKDSGFSDIFGFTPSHRPFWGSRTTFYDFPYIDSFASETTIPLPLFPKMYTNYIKGTDLEQQQLELYKEEVDNYLKTRSAAKQSYVYNDSEVSKLKRMRERMEDLLAEVKRCETIANTNAEVTFDDSYPKLSSDITDHLVNLDLLTRIDAAKTKAYIKPTEVDKLSKKLETISTEFASIRIKYPEAFL
jgi:hypothetical protein